MEKIKINFFQNIYNFSYKNFNNFLYSFTKKKKIINFPLFNKMEKNCFSILLNKKFILNSNKYRILINVFNFLL